MTISLIAPEKGERLTTTGKLVPLPSECEKTRFAMRIKRRNLRLALQRRASIQMVRSAISDPVELLKKM
jgi:hypothetical protein